MRTLTRVPVLFTLLALTPVSPSSATSTAAPVDNRAVMRKVFEYQVEAQKARKYNGWERAAFYAGVMAAFDATGDKDYLDQARRWSSLHDWTPPVNDPRHADNQAVIQTFAELFLKERHPRYLAAARRVFDRQMSQPRRGRDEWWWCDALFMAPPALVRMSRATGDPRYTAFMNEMWWDTTDFLYDPADHLFYRDKNFFNRRTASGKKVFWSRGNGWVLAGTARVLQYLPEGHADRTRYVDLFRQMAKRIARLQGEDGLWRVSLLDPDEYPAPETSGSGFFVYALAWGVNNGILDGSEYRPVVERGWTGLVGKVHPSGRLGFVQRVAAAPGDVGPDDTHEYGAGAFLMAGSEILRMRRLHFDFGAATAEPGFVTVTPGSLYSSDNGFGWVGPNDLVLRDRRTPDALRRDYVFGHEPATFRVHLEPGLYRLTMITGDMEYGDHVLIPATDASGDLLPALQQKAGEFSTLTTTVDVRGATLDVCLASPVDNWVLNALTLEPVRVKEPARVEKQRFAVPVRNLWPDVHQTTDPIAPYVNRFLGKAPNADQVRATGLTRQDYLRVITGVVDFFKGYQKASGAIIDPYMNKEFQYSTPAFAHAAALLVAHDGRADLLEPAAKAMDWATNTLRHRKAANAHEDFYAPMLAHALPLLKTRVDPARARRWEDDIRSFDPFETYRSAPGGGNWNVVALSGEGLFHAMGLRTDLDFLEQSLAAQGRFFSSPWGLYLEGPMAYDHFPRAWAADLIAHGYDGPYAGLLRDTLQRGGLTSLFMQSPRGELPVGGRSAQHQWNEAEQCVTYEIYAADAAKRGNTVLAGAFKRAAHLALASMKRWIRPSGEMWIVKNRVDPARRHGYEGYSSHSQYNLLPMSLLAIAWEHAEKTENLSESATPSESEGFMLRVDDTLHQVFAAASGTFVQVDITANPHYNATGLARVHFTGVDPQLGLTDSLTATPSYQLPGNLRTTLAAGIAWKDTRGDWLRLAELDADRITGVSLVHVQEGPQRVSFDVLYQGYFSGPSLVVERYVITPGKVELTTELPGYEGPLRYEWPVHADNGAEKTTITVVNPSVRVSRSGQTVLFTPVDAAQCRVGEDRYPTRNGWSRIATAEYLNSRPVTLRIECLP